MSETDYHNNFKSVIEGLIYNLVSERPKNVADFMIEYLRKKGNYTSNGNIYSNNN
jgi:hypothetical protein